MIRNDPKTTLNAFLRVKTILLRQFQRSKIFRKFAYKDMLRQNFDFKWYKINPKQLRTYF